MIKVDKGKCIGCGACIVICPDVFEMGSDGKSSVKNDNDLAECVNQAIESCPVQAISK